MGAAAPAGIALAGSGLSAYESVQGGKAQSAYYSYLADTARLNAGLSRSEATAQKQQIGTEEAHQEILLGQRVRQTVGAETAGVVSGAGASSRTAQDIEKDTITKGNLDEMALRLNADMRSKNADIAARSGAMNYTAQASGYEIGGMNARAAGNLGAISSLIGGVGNAANSFYMGQLYAGRGYSNQSGGIGQIQ